MTDYPTIKALTSCLAEIKADTAWTDDMADEDGTVSMDVRLQVIPDDGWQLHTGDASYDTDHHGYWGTGSLSPRDTIETLRETAKDLIEQAKDDQATDEA